ncbi:hypothetical protein BpHYR1_050701 [Brachionus plicatilis]|uniref:Uncharacterized protein n=1 Tax=Brachionus plicatilis TaxID=10195 RepID=A0A3M7QF83_BRAPC|nr:hypothetical protein BpHYR1_050701 [Brachionus plicatilis]
MQFLFKHSERFFEHFVGQLENLYDSHILKSGVHELLHFVDSVKECGPLNILSCYQFEELNRKITTMIKSRDLIGDEFIKLWNVSQCFSIYNYFKEETSNLILAEKICVGSRSFTVEKNNTHKFGYITKFCKLRSHAFAICEQAAYIDNPFYANCDKRLKSNFFIYINSNEQFIVDDLTKIEMRFNHKLNESRMPKKKSLALLPKTRNFNKKKKCKTEESSFHSSDPNLSSEKEFHESDDSNLSDSEASVEFLTEDNWILVVIFFKI